MLISKGKIVLLLTVVMVAVDVFYIFDVLIMKTETRIYFDETRSSATFYVDNKLVRSFAEKDTTDFERITLFLKRGKHELKLSKPGFPDVIDSVQFGRYDGEYYTELSFSK